MGFINIVFGFSNDNAKLVVLSLATEVQNEWYNTKRKAGWHSLHSFCFIIRLLDAFFSFLMWTIFKILINYNIASAVFMMLLLLLLLFLMATRHVPNIGRRSLNQWTTREVPVYSFKTKELLIPPSFYLFNVPVFIYRLK